MMSKFGSKSGDFAQRVNLSIIIKDGGYDVSPYLKIK
jgi:hypothetical protein